MITAGTRGIATCLFKFHSLPRIILLRLFLRLCGNYGTLLTVDISETNFRLEYPTGKIVEGKVIVQPIITRKE